MKIIDLLKKTEIKKPIELMYCLQAYTDIGKNLPVWKDINRPCSKHEYNQITRLTQHKLNGSVYDLIEVIDHNNHAMIMLGHWNDGETF